MFDRIDWLGSGIVLAVSLAILWATYFWQHKQLSKLKNEQNDYAADPAVIDIDRAMGALGWAAVELRSEYRKRQGLLTAGVTGALLDSANLAVKLAEQRLAITMCDCDLLLPAVATEPDSVEPGEGALSELRK